MAALEKAARRPPADDERETWEAGIRTCASFYEVELRHSGGSVSRSDALSELDEIREAAKTLSNRLTNLSRDAYYTLRFGWLDKAGLSPSEDEEAEAQISYRLGDGPKLPGDLAQQMRTLERLAERAKRHLPEVSNGDRSVYEAQVGSPLLVLFGDAIRLMDRLAGRVYALRPFVCAIHELATGEIPSENWAKEPQATASAWWREVGPYDGRIFEAGNLWPQSGDRWEWIAEKTGIPMRIIRLSWGPWMLRDSGTGEK